MILSNLRVHWAGINGARGCVLESRFFLVLLGGELSRLALEGSQAFFTAKIEGFACMLNVMWGVFLDLHSTHRIGELGVRVSVFNVVFVTVNRFRSEECSVGKECVGRCRYGWVR